MGAPAPLENFAGTPKKSFATISPSKQTLIGGLLAAMSLIAF